MIVKTGKIIIKDNEIKIRDFKLSEDTNLQLGRLEILQWAKEELNYAMIKLGA